MTGRDRDEYIQSMVKRKPDSDNPDLRGLKAALVLRTAIDLDGEPLWDQLDEIQDKCASAIDRIYEVAEELNGLSTKEEEAATSDFAPATSECFGIT